MNEQVLLDDRLMEVQKLAHPKVDDLLGQTDSRYTLVIMASRRARQINSYVNSSRRGELPQTVGPQVENPSDNPLTVAFEEIKEGKVTYERVVDGIK